MILFFLVGGGVVRGRASNPLPRVWTRRIDGEQRLCEAQLAKLRHPAVEELVLVVRWAGRRYEPRCTAGGYRAQEEPRAHSRAPVQYIGER